MPSICAAPGCPVAVYSVTKTKTCRMHVHSQWCQCRMCVERRAGERPPREGVRTVFVNCASTYSGATHVARVTLPLEPWEVEP